jgi:hypothetical protein
MFGSEEIILWMAKAEMKKFYKQERKQLLVKVSM